MFFKRFFYHNVTVAIIVDFVPFARANEKFKNVFFLSRFSPPFFICAEHWKIKAMKVIRRSFSGRKRTRRWLRSVPLNRNRPTSICKRVAKHHYKASENRHQKNQKVRFMTEIAMLCRAAKFLFWVCLLASNERNAIQEFAILFCGENFNSNWFENNNVTGEWLNQFWWKIEMVDFLYLSLSLHRSLHWNFSLNAKVWLIGEIKINWSVLKLKYLGKWVGVGRFCLNFNGMYLIGSRGFH